MTILLLGCITLISGCWGWGHTEIEDLALVVGMGIDLADDQSGNVECTLQIANPAALVSSQGGNSNETKTCLTVSGQGKNVWEALYSIHPQISSRLFYGHTRLYVIGENAARQGIAPFLDGLRRFRDTRQNVNIVIARGQARQILEAELPPGKVSSLALSNMFEIEAGSTLVFPVDLNEFYYRLNNRAGTGQFAPVITLAADSVGKTESKGPSSSPAIKVSGLAVFDRDGKLVDFFGESETRGLIWILNKAQNQNLTVISPDQPDQSLSLHVVESESRIIVKTAENELPSFEIRIKAMADMLEYFGVYAGELSPDYYNRLEEAAGTVIEQEIMTSINKAQALNVDLFEFGEEIKRQHSGEWESRWKDSWEEAFPLVNVTVTVETGTRHRGQTTNPSQFGGGGGITNAVSCICCLHPWSGFYRRPPPG